MAAVLRTVCAWCGVLICDGAEPTSHGICMPCAARMRALDNPFDAAPEDEGGRQEEE